MSFLVFKLLEWNDIPERWAFAGPETGWGVSIRSRIASPISDESFVKAWGNLPEEPLTLCGTSRFVRECRGSLRTSPTPTRIQVKPTVQLQIESGRIAMTVEAELVELSGHLRQVEAELPRRHPSHPGDRRRVDRLDASQPIVDCT